MVPNFYDCSSHYFNMSGRVWYISVSKKKIEFKKYPKKQKQVKNKTSKTKNVVFGFLSLAVSIFFINLISAAEINDTLHINIQTTYSNGTIQSGTFVFAFNITENSSASCLGPVAYNHSTSQTTDSRGIVSIYLPTIGSGAGNLSSLSFDRQYYLCYYRDGTLKDVSQLGRVPYSFRAAQVNLSKVDIDSNLTLGNFNVSASSGFFTFLGSLINRINKIFATDANISNNLEIGGNLSVNTNLLFVNKNDSSVGINTSNPLGLLHVVANGTNALFVNSTTGYVGIGITSPDHVLDVRNPISSGAELGIFSTTNNDATIDIGTNNDTDWEIESRDALSDALVIRKEDSGSADVLVLTQTGLVGINTTTPQNTLNVFGAINSTTGFIVNSSVGLTGNFSVGSCWFAYKGGIAYGTNCTAL